MVRSDELYNEVTNDSSGKGASQGMAIGCFIDTATGIMSFTCEGKETSYKFKVKSFFSVNTFTILIKKNYILDGTRYKTISCYIRRS